MTNPARLMLIVEDDAVFARTLARSFERREYTVLLASGLGSLLDVLELHRPRYAVVDLKLNGESGLSCVKALHAFDPAISIVVLTGFASISTAVEAVKLGACHYLTKPASTDDIEAAFAKGTGDESVAVTERQTSLKTLEWERIHQTLIDVDFNVSEAARRLGMHRRTLARKLEKWRVK
ncbi:MAG: response regulator transcription factor [Micavibrio sp.]|nr:response regulator transcription factor [Micavibrio sp.]